MFRRLLLDGLMRLHAADKLAFFGAQAGLPNPDSFATYLAPQRKTVYAKPPFGGPEAVLAYLSRYTHRIAISNSRLISANAATVTFKWKGYRIKRGDRLKVMSLPTDEFIRRFLTHVLPSGFHRIRHTGLLANGIRHARTIAKLARPAMDGCSMMSPSYPTLQMQGIGQINAACHQKFELACTDKEKIKCHSTITGLRNWLECSLRRQIGATKAQLIASL